MKPKVIFENVSKSYTLYENKFDKLLDIFTTKKKNKTFYALRDVSFEVYEGETIGIIGANGSGKSTLSNLLAQVLPPTSGKITINGETSLIAISAGLNNNLTGMENIEIKCLMHGLKKEEIKGITPDIIEFADIGDFINQPVKNYSSGMKSRLGFAISVHTDPDILIIDEALSVGDETFYEKCLAKMDEFKRRGKTIFFISHSVSQIRSFCDKVMWLHHGKVEDYGRIGKVLKGYKDYISWHKSLSAVEQKKYKREMLAKQMLKDANTLEKEETQGYMRSRSIRKKKSPIKKEKKNYLIAALFLFFLINAFLMLNNGLESKVQIPDLIKTEKKQKPTEAIAAEKKVSVINKEGFVSENQSEIFAEEEKKNLMTNADFYEKVMVLEQINDLYKVEMADGVIGYTQESNITIQDMDRNISSLTINELLPITPNAFRGSYEFYLSYLTSKEDTITNSLNGLSDVIEENTNEKMLVFGNGNIKYRIKDGISNAIIIENIDLDLPESDLLLENAIVTDKDGNNGVIVTEDYTIMFNKIEKSLTIEIK
jgi:teichoic acid transport system ATP-binding protein